jgi:ectoine hydroxylase-related dioxygenase (phytanoyl-CoA dioxygenase family)
MMTSKTYFKEILKNIYYKTFFKTGPITETLAPFQFDSFREETLKLKDEFIKRHALEIIDNGYTVVKNSVDSNLLDEFVIDFYNWKKRNMTKFDSRFFKFDDKLDRVINLQASLTKLKDLFSTNKALIIQDYLFQSETTLYSSLFFEVGSAQDIHRDIPLFWTRPTNMYFGTWLALEDTDANNGPLVVIPGSHKLPLFDRNYILKNSGFLNKHISEHEDILWFNYQRVVQEECAKKSLNIVEVHVEKGDTIIWHPLLAHGGKEIRDKSRTRLSHVVHTTPINVPVYHIDVFFNSEAKVPINAPWNYESHLGRRLVKHNKINIKHVRGYDYNKLK